MKKSKKTRTKQNKTGKHPCDICTEPNYLDAHHILGRKIPNFNHSSNIASVCQNCHRKIHKGDIIVEKWVMSSSGLQLLWHCQEDDSFTDEDSIPYLIPNSDK